MKTDPNHPTLFTFENSRIYQILGPYIQDLQGTPDELKHCFEQSLGLLNEMQDQDLDLRYAPGKWTLRELWMHLIDSTQILSFRLLSLMRGHNGTLPTADEELWVKNTESSHIGWEDLKQGYALHTQALLWNLLTYKHKPEHFIVCNQTVIHFANMMRYIIGHERLHRQSIKEKYLS